VYLVNIATFGLTLQEALERIRKFLANISLELKRCSMIKGCYFQSMYEQGKMAQVIAEMKRYMLVISIISESRWTRSGRMKTGTGETISSLIKNATLKCLTKLASLDINCPKQPCV